MIVLPTDVYDALKRNAKTWLVTNFVGGTHKLEAYSDHYAQLISVYSFCLRGTRSANLRRLVRLVESGVLVERPRWREGAGARSFTLPRAQLDVLAAEATKELEGMGYVVGVVMAPINEARAVA